MGLHFMEPYQDIERTSTGLFKLLEMIEETHSKILTLLPQKRKTMNNVVPIV